MKKFRPPPLIRIDEDIELRFFDPCYALELFQRIHSANNANDAYQASLQKKYDALEKVAGRIEDAVNE